MSLSGPVYLIGAGKMGLALARGWLAGGLKAAELVLVDPGARDETRDFAARAGVHLVDAAPGTAPRVLVLAVKPQVIGTVMAALRPVVGPQTLVVSIAAGTTLDQLADGIGSDRVVRTMPNTPAQIGKGITGVVAGLAVGPEDRTLAEALLGAAGAAVWLEREADIDALTAVSGSGPAYVFHLVEALAAAGEAEGLPAEQAMALARQTVIGAAALLEADPAPAAELRQNVTSPNGTTAAGLAILMAELPDLVARTVAAARRRSTELGRGA